MSGTPADCVIIAVNKVMNKKADLILSGVNIGSNVGDDICYSGTVGTVMEGAARSIPSITLNQIYYAKIDWHNTKVFAPKVIAKLVKVGWPKNIVLSVNFPATEKVKGGEFAEQGEYNMMRI